MSEYCQHIGCRAELRRMRFSKEVEAGSLRDSQRIALDPICDPAKLDTERIVSLSVRLAEVVGEILEIDAKIDAINKVIGK